MHNAVPSDAALFPSAPAAYKLPALTGPDPFFGDQLTIGGTGPMAVCGDGGNFQGTIDEVSVSRIARHIGTPLPPDAALPGDGSPGDRDAATGREGPERGSEHVGRHRREPTACRAP